MATSAQTMRSTRTSPPPRVALAAAAVAAVGYGLGAVSLAGEAAVHVQQFANLFHAVRWIGPLFLANAIANVAVIAGLAWSRTRRLAGFAGVAISAVALGSLVVSYGQGLFGWQEAGFRSSVAVAVITEVAAVILLAMALVAGGTEAAKERSAGPRQRRSRRGESPA
jgi:hypothetical protein